MILFPYTCWILKLAYVPCFPVDGVRQARELEAARERAQALSKADTEGRKVNYAHRVGGRFGSKSWWFPQDKAEVQRKRSRIAFNSEFSATRSADQTKVEVFS